MLINIKTEAKEFGIEKLSHITGLSRSNIYEIINGNIKPRIDTYEKLLGALGYKISIEKNSKQKSNDLKPGELKENLIRFGAPLYSEKKKFKKINLNESLLEALKAGRFDTSTNSILPYFINKNLKSIDLDKISKTTSEKKYLGYLLNIILLIENNFELSEHLEFLKSHSSAKVEVLIKNKDINKYQEMAFKKTENICAKDWGFKTLDSLEDIKARYIKWSH